MLIRDVMTTPAVTVTTGSSTGSVLRLMHEEQICSVPVVDDRGALIGIISETELLQDAVLADRVPAGRVSGTSPSRKVGHALTHHVITVSPDDKIEPAIALLRSTTLEHLPVVENDRVVGTVGSEDMVRKLPESPRGCELEVSAGTAAADPVRRTRRHR